ncbi:type I secretion system permease/ATPase [Microvirga antarctica]|uniref:type I secretion system permease/ATPase n=1 Tax=Microvirga antarctica TaxID=2819233 RepID=UPI001B30F188|nr:type I secretion system permease/ATPase [Microvirga antarctica]
MSTYAGSHDKEHDIRATLWSCKAHFIFAFFFNSFVNVLMLAYPVFMIQVFDRVIPGRSWETLIALVFGLAISVCAQGIFQWVRGTLLVRASARIEGRLADRLFQTIVRRSGAGSGPANAQLMRDLDGFRQFATGRGGIAFIDLPWGFVFLGVIFVVDSLMGVVALICIFISAVATIANSVFTKRALIKANVVGNSSQQFGEAVTRTAEAVMGLGMLSAVVRRWRGERDRAIHEQFIASGRGVVFSSFMGSARILMQGVLMAAGAVQLINGLIPGGVMFAAVIVFQFAMRPIDQAIGAWEEYHNVKQAMNRIDAALADVSDTAVSLHLPRPSGSIACREVTFVPPGSDKPILKRISFFLQAGQSLGLIGLNGSGKSTLARILTGSMHPTAGSVRIDGAELDQWSNEAFGRFVGYLPQSVSLLPGTVADNIGRFGTFSDDEIIDAAKRARVHDLVLRLPQGYETPLDENLMFSGGQRQLIALARAIVGKPAFVVLDEPNSNLDGPGEEALIACIEGLKELGTTVILITHRPNLVVHLDHAAVLREGMLVNFGPTQDIFKQLGRPTVVKKMGGANA